MEKAIYSGECELKTCAAYDELLGDDASLIAQQAVSDAGYNVSIDPKGVHRITSSTIKLIGKIINKAE
ncbi:MAG: hypothetical protein IIW77_06155 [Bacteroidaceae bacterium]|nr:hypothetical protein [Bacteroidaceae bacterium]